MATPSVLVVENEVLIRLELGEVFRQTGFTVAVVGDASDAIAALEASISKVRALVTDINLGSGELSGWEVARRARLLNPAIPVVYLTGRGTDEWAAYGVPHSVLLTKPCSLYDVTDAVARLMVNVPFTKLNV